MFKSCNEQVFLPLFLGYFLKILNIITLQLFSMHKKNKKLRFFNPTGL